MNYTGSMKCIVGLGNPEQRYDHTRHNIGFWVIDQFAKDHDVVCASKTRFQAIVGELTTDNVKVLLVKPQAYYNLSGEAVRAIADFYKIAPEDILVVHDEMSLPFGTLRTRYGGSDAGNNGIKSINDHLGLSTARLRIGTYNTSRDVMDDADFVLSRFTSDEQSSLVALYPKISSRIDSFIAGTFSATTDKTERPQDRETER